MGTSVQFPLNTWALPTLTVPRESWWYPWRAATVIPMAALKGQLWEQVVGTVGKIESCDPCL